MTPIWKGLALRAMGLFLFFQWFSGNLSLYIHERFTILIVLASFGLMLMGAMYHTRRTRDSGEHSHHHDHHGHFPRGGFFLVLLLMIFGLMAPRSPLGSDAMRTRRVSTPSNASPGASGNNRLLLKTSGERTILDWVTMFLVENNPESFLNESATLSGFVYHDERSGKELFMLGRFVITCCTADASPVGLYVFWPEGGSLLDDQWLEVSGHFEVREIGKQATPVLIAETVTLIETPAQPYLYP